MGLVSLILRMFVFLLDEFVTRIIRLLRDEEGDETANQAIQQGDGPAISGTGNPFLDVPNITGATEFKKGYVMRKCCYDSNGKKSNIFYIIPLETGNSFFPVLSTIRK